MFSIMVLFCFKGREKEKQRPRPRAGVLLAKHLSEAPVSLVVDLLFLFPVHS
jgi:hypothetical protein